MTDLNARMEAGAAQAKALRAQAAAEGLEFQAYLPPEVADWVLGLIEAGLFREPSEAIRALLRRQIELWAHKDLHDELLKRMFSAAMDDPTSLLNDVIAEWRARSSPPGPPQWQNSDGRVDRSEKAPER